jgi:reductive dehalogenase
MKIKKTQQDNNQEPKDMSRRDFAKSVAMSGLGAIGASLSGSLEAFAEQEEKIQENRRKYTSTVEGKPYKMDEAIYKRFSQTNIAFNVVSREMGKPWIPEMLGNMMHNSMQGKSSGTVDAGSKENARAEVAMTLAGMLANGYNGWHGEGHENMGVLNWNNMVTEVPEVPPVYPPHPGPTNKDAADLTTKVKFMARMAGADLVGICKLDRNWIYSENQKNTHTHEKPNTKPIVFENIPHPKETEDRLIIPDDTKYVIVTAYAMNRRMYQTSPSLMGQFASSVGYARMGFSGTFMAEFLRVMGYNAIPCKNSTGLSVPMAVEAGLGEAGRHSVLITPEYGPLVRIDKMLTNMPLVPDKPIKFGVEEFCGHCKKCARECPSKSITNGPQTWSGKSVCNNPGVLKWHNDLEKCLNFWVENGTECGNCLAVCPFTKGAMWTHDATRWAIDKAKFLDPVWLTMDDAFGYGEHRENQDIWTSNIGTYGLDPDHLKNTMK